MGSARPVPPPPLPRRAACHAVTAAASPPQPCETSASQEKKKKKEEIIGGGWLSGKAASEPRVSSEECGVHLVPSYLEVTSWHPFLGPPSCTGSRLREEAEPWVALLRTGWPCAYGFLHLASLGPGQWGTTGGSRRHICLASSRLCPLVALVWRDLYLPEHGGSELAMEKGLSSLTRGQSPRAGIPRLILSEYAGGERPARHFRDTGDPSLGLSEHTYRVS